MTSIPSFGPFLAELVLVVAGLAMVLIGAIRGETSKCLIDWVAIGALVLAGILVIEQGPGVLQTFNGAFVSDEFARFMKVLTLLGSLAAIILSSGYNIAGPEVEAALLSHPDVAECAVVGAPDQDRGQIVEAHVVLRAGASADAICARRLQDHVKAMIAPYKYPRAIRFRESLPKTSTGKVQRFRLKRT